MTRSVIAVAAALAVAACASPEGPAPKARPLELTSSAGWPDLARDGNAWAAWHDAALDRLIDEALATQPSLQAVQLRVRQAAAQADVVGAARLPQLSASLDLTDQRFTENGLFPKPLAGSTYWNNSAQIGATWEWDLFGRQQAALAAALGQQRAAAAEAQAAGLLLSANLAAGWVQLARALEQRRIGEAALAERDQVLAIVRQRVGAGLDNSVDLRQAEGSVAQTRLEIAAADEQIARARHALAELSGRRADALDAVSPALAPLRAQALPAGLPADLIGRRADVVAQRWRVEAARHDVDVARAQFYPNINLVAFAGLASLGLDRFVQAGSMTYGAGPAVRLPLFDGGRLRANLGAKATEADIAVETYNTTLLRALREVADEVSSLPALEAQQREQDAALAAAEAAFDLATQRYRAGLGNFLVVLTAEGNVLVQRRGAADLKARHLLAEVNLSRALGGGLATEAPAATVAERRIP
jgi:NodT family efflux transporter outer membrane factor (OMF) lipoprotein